MYIQLLYILPLVALSILVLILILNYQRRKEGTAADSRLSKQVEEFNEGLRPEPPVQLRVLPESHLSEIEKTIGLVSQALSSQQRVIERFQGADTKVADEIDKMKLRLRELQKEYDIVLSENYSLRAKVRKLSERTQNQPDAQKFKDTDELAPAQSTRADPLGDTKKLAKNPIFDDTTEIDIADLKN
jgi:chromosome segregation ATPase